MKPNRCHDRHLRWRKVAGEGFCTAAGQTYQQISSFARVTIARLCHTSLPSENRFKEGKHLQRHSKDALPCPLPGIRMLFAPVPHALAVKLQRKVQTSHARPRAPSALYPQTVRRRLIDRSTCELAGGKSKRQKHPAVRGPPYLLLSVISRGCSGIPKSWKSCPSACSPAAALALSCALPYVRFTLRS